MLLSILPFYMINGKFAKDSPSGRWEKQPWSTNMMGMLHRTTTPTGKRGKRAEKTPMVILLPADFSAKRMVSTRAGVFLF
jgi:hypothetical protein